MYNIMIVDDDKLARKGLMSIIPWANYNMNVVADVANGSLALEVIKKTNVDLMFVDLQMPVVDGFELMKQVKAEFPNMQFIILTFHEDFEFVQQALRLGAIEFLSKARLENEDLDEILTRALSILNSTWNKQEEQFAFSTTDDADSEKIQNLISEWSDAKWLYNDSTWVDLELRTLNMDLSLRDIDKLIIHTERNINGWYLFDDFIDMENITSAMDVVNLFRSLKEILFKRILSVVNFETIHQSILKAASITHLKLNDSKMRAEDVAVAVNMSRSYFCTTFKRVTGITYLDYLQRERVLYTGNLLCTTDCDIEKIAKMVGYEDVKYLDSLFFKHFGNSMIDYRNANNVKNVYT